jgi:hypothetical protein
MHLPFHFRLHSGMSKIKFKLTSCIIIKPVHYAQITNNKIGERNSTEEKVHAISWLERGERLLTYAIMLDSLIAACVQYAITLQELQKVNRTCLCSTSTRDLSEWIVTKNYGCLLHFYCIKNILHRNVYCIYSIHILLEVYISTSGTVIHYIGLGYQSLSPWKCCF